MIKHKVTWGKKVRNQKLRKESAPQKTKGVG